jgi:hypothetical protein
MEANFLKYVGERRRFAMLLGGYFSRTPFYVKDVDDDVAATLRFGRYGAYLRTQTARSDQQTFGVELAWEHTYETPVQGGLVEVPLGNATTVVDLGWIDRFRSERWATRAFMQFDNTDRPIYPRRGWKVQASVGHLWGVNASYTFNESFISELPAQFADQLRGDVQVNDYDQFQRMVVQAGTAQQLSSRFSLLAGGALSLCTERTLTPGDQLLIGGMKANGRESLAFWGLNEYDEQLAEFAMVRGGFQWELVKDLYWQVQGNGLFTALRPGFEVLDNGGNTLWGVGTTLGIRTTLGVVQVGAANNLSSSEWLGYFNFGFRL